MTTAPHARVTRRMVTNLPPKFRLGDLVRIVLSDTTEAVCDPTIFGAFDGHRGIVECIFTTIRTRLDYATVLFDEPVRHRGYPCVRCSFPFVALQLIPEDS